MMLTTTYMAMNGRTFWGSLWDADHVFAPPHKIWRWSGIDRPEFYTPKLEYLTERERRAEELARIAPSLRRFNERLKKERPDSPIFKQDKQVKNPSDLKKPPRELRPLPIKWDRRPTKTYEERFQEALKRFQEMDLPEGTYFIDDFMEPPEYETVIEGVKAK